MFVYVVDRITRTVGVFYLMALANLLKLGIRRLAIDEKILRTCEALFCTALIGDSHE